MGTVTVENLSLHFNTAGATPVIALNNLSMKIPDKQFAVIVGPSGCGKSSLLDIIAGLRDPTTGDCKLDGKVIHGPAKERGMVFQNYSLFPGSPCSGTWSSGCPCKASRRRKSPNAPATM